MTVRGQGEQHGLPRDPFKALVAPRPIGWISSLDKTGRVNLAPFSFFNAVADRPPTIVFAPNGPRPGGGTKDTLRNIEQTNRRVVETREVHDFECEIWVGDEKRYIQHVIESYQNLARRHADEEFKPFGSA